MSGVELCDVLAKLPMTKAGRRQGKETERVHERVDATVAEAEAGRALLHRLKNAFDPDAKLEPLPQP